MFCLFLSQYISLSLTISISLFLSVSLYRCFRRFANNYNGSSENNIPHYRSRSILGTTRSMTLLGKPKVHTHMVRYTVGRTVQKRFTFHSLTNLFILTPTLVLCVGIIQPRCNYLSKSILCYISTMHYL